MRRKTDTAAPGGGDGSAAVGASLRALGPALGMAAVVIAMLAVASARPPDVARQVAVVFAPGTPFDQAVGALARVGATPVRDGGVANIVVADLGRARDLSTLDIPGAWFLLEPRAIGTCSRPGPAGDPPIALAPATRLAPTTRLVASGGAPGAPLTPRP